MGLLAQLMLASSLGGGAPAPVQPEIGLRITYSADTMGNSDSFTFAGGVTVPAGGGMIVGYSMRNNGAPGASFDSCDLSPDVGDDVAMDFIAAGYLAGAGRMVGGLAIARNLAAGTYTPVITPTANSNRDFVGIAAPITGLRSTGSYYGTPAAISINSSDTDITRQLTATDAAGLMVAFGAFGQGGRTLTANNADLLTFDDSGNGGTGLDHTAGLVKRDSAASGDITFGLTSDAADDDRAIVAVELLSS